MLKRFLFLSCVLLSSIMTMWAQTEATVSPTLDVNFRTGAGNTAWNNGYPKSAADEGNTEFECNYFNGLFALQKYTVTGLQNATKLVLTLYAGSGTDAIRVWSFPNNDWTADSGVDDMVGYATQAVGIAPRTSEGTLNTPLVTKGTWGSSGLNPRPATFTIEGTALATVKANASSDGTFTLMLTDGNLTSASNRKYLTSNSANGDGVPTLTATVETPTATINGTGYASLEEAFDAAVAAVADATIEVSADQKLTKRQTLSVNDITITIVPTQDITITGPNNAMWFLANKSGATLKIGSSDYKITLDGESKAHTGSNQHITRRESGASLYLTNIEFKNFTSLGDNALVSCTNHGGAIYLEDIAITDCATTGNALIENLREADDALYLKGFLNIGTDCTGAGIYTKNRIRLGEPGDNAIYNDFSATNAITINWASSTTAIGTAVVVKAASSMLSSFSLVNENMGLFHSGSDIKLTQAYSLSVGEAGAATLVLPFASTIPTTPTGLTCYKLDYTSGDNITATPESGTLAANSPVLVMGTANTSYKFVSTATSGDLATGSGQTSAYGVLVGNYAADYVVPATSGEEPNVNTTNYILSYKDSQLGFRKVDGSTNKVQPYRAYLSVKHAAAQSPRAFFGIDFGGETTAVSEELRVKSEEFTTATYYNLAGQRVEKPTRGLYIVNGKKVIIK
jgi:hypothetical protein